MLESFINTNIYAIFALTYALIASRRLRILPIGRPAGALLGAVLMVAVGALTPEQSYRAIDHDTIVLLFGMMVLTVYLERAGFFQWLTFGLLRLCRTPFGLLLTLAFISGTLSALLVNDTVCFFLTPVVVSVCRLTGLPIGPFLLAIATSSNIGSFATLVGNPQNMIIGSLSGLSFARFAAYATPVAAACLLINAGLLWLYFGRRLPRTIGQKAPARPAVAMANAELVRTLLVTGLIFTGFLGGLHLGYTTLFGVMILILADRKDPREVMARVDWSLLVFFCGLFIVMAGLARTGIVEKAFTATVRFAPTDATGLAVFTAVMTIGANLLSNVPMVLLTGPHLDQLGAGAMGWVLLSFTTTVAGNFTLLGSVANIIVAERARDHYNMGFFEYLRFGLVSTLIVLGAGVTLIFMLFF